MIAPALNVPAPARILLLALAATGILVMGMLTIGRRESVAPAMERPVFARRMETLPAIVVSAPADGAGEVVARVR